MNLMRNNFIWLFFKPIAFIGLYANAKRREFILERDRERDKDLKIIEGIFQDTHVKNGPFKDLKYPSLNSYGSMLFPKLLGSYEKELHQVLYEFKTQKFNSILDIGCAEGYYAIGFAMGFDTQKVIAYDTSEQAQELTRNMAGVNGIKDKIEIKGYCSEAELLSMDPAEVHLILSDCEGFEIDLLTERVARHLERSFFIIEAHYHFNIDVVNILSERFSATHNIEKINSTDDYQKVYDYNFPEIAHLTSKQKKMVLQECRQYIMTWLIFRPKTN